MSDKPQTLGTRFDVPDELINLVELQLSWLTFHALELIIERLLLSLAYRDVEVLSRTFLKGRTDHGGVDLRASVQTPLGLLPAVIQIRHRNQPIARADIHMLRGAMLANAAPVGVMFATTEFAPPAIVAAQGFQGRPVWLVGRRQLARLLIDTRNGVQETVSPHSGKRKLMLVPEFFQAFEAYASAHRTKGISIDAIHD